MTAPGWQRRHAWGGEILLADFTHFGDCHFAADSTGGRRSRHPEVVAPGLALLDDAFDGDPPCRLEC